jgi:hypothetical protein
LESITLIDVTDVPVLMLERTFEGRPCAFVVPDIGNFTPADWQRVETYYREIGFPDYVISGQFEKYVSQALQNLGKDDTDYEKREQS